MDIKPIRTEEDYRAALEEVVDWRMDAQPETPDGDRLRAQDLFRARLTPLACSGKE